MDELLNNLCFCTKLVVPLDLSYSRINTVILILYQPSPPLFIRTIKSIITR